MAFTPLAYLPGRYGLMLWNIVSIAVLVWAMHVLARDVFPAIGRRARVRFLTLTLGGSTVGIWSSQSNALLMASIALALAAIVRQRWWTVSILLAVPVFIKIWPLAIVLLLVAFWPRQLIGRFAVACAGLAAVPFLTRPPRIVAWQYCEWYKSLTDNTKGRWPGYRDAWTIWEQLYPPVNRHVYMAIQLAAALGVLGWCWWQYRRELPPPASKGTVPFSLRRKLGQSPRIAS